MGAGKAIALFLQISAGVEVKPFSSKDHGLLKYFVITQLFDLTYSSTEFSPFFESKKQKFLDCFDIEENRIYKSSGIFSFFLLQMDQIWVRNVSTTEYW